MGSAGMTGRLFLKVLLLLIASVPLSRVVAWPRWNPLPICVAMPVMAVVVLRDRERPLHWFAVAGLIGVGASLGFALIITALVLDYGRVFPTAGFQFGRTYYPWDTFYVPASAYVGALTTVILLRRFDLRRDGGAGRGRQKETP